MMSGRRWHSPLQRLRLSQVLELGGRVRSHGSCKKEGFVSSVVSSAHHKGHEGTQTQENHLDAISILSIAIACDPLRSNTRPVARTVLATYGSKRLRSSVSGMVCEITL